MPKLLISKAEEVGRAPAQKTAQPVTHGPVIKGSDYVKLPGPVLKFRKPNCKKKARQKTYQRRRALKEFGLTERAYESLFTAQGGRCAICRTPPDEGRHLAVDHNHQTGEVRGLLCTRCNMGLGFFKDSPERLITALEYLHGR